MQVPTQLAVLRRRLAAGILIGVVVGATHALVSHGSSRANAQSASDRRQGPGTRAIAVDETGGVTFVIVYEAGAAKVYGIKARGRSGSETGSEKK